VRNSIIVNGVSVVIGLAAVIASIVTTALVGSALNDAIDPGVRFSVGLVGPAWVVGRLILR
jgi:glycerol uptake facilitator-like aquaporin